MEKLDRPNHIGYLDGLRAMAAIYVVAFHSLLYVGTSFNAPELSNGLLARLYSYFLFLMYQGHSAVTLFIMLSGFCLMLPITRHGELRGGALTFFKKRARRILPPYFATIVISLFLIWAAIGAKSGTDWDQALPISLKDILAHLLLIQDLFTATRGKINPVLWSISVEWRIYFLFPVLLIGWKKFGSLLVVVAAVIISLLVQSTLHLTPFDADSTGICAHYVGIFTLGMLACDISFTQGKYALSEIKLPWGVFSFIGMILALGLIRVAPRVPFYIVDMFVALATFSLLVSLSRYQSGIAFSLLSAKPIAFLGTFAYSIYLIHAPVLQLIHHFVLPNLHVSYYTTIFAVYFGGTFLSVVMAYLFHLSFERPFINAKGIKS